MDAIKVSVRCPPPDSLKAYSRSVELQKVPQMRLLKRQGSDPPSTPTLGSLHLTPHHLIFRSVGATELWVRSFVLYRAAGARLGCW